MEILIPMPMKNILSKYSDCNKFSLTGNIFVQFIKITKEEYARETEKMNLQEKMDFTDKNTVRYQYNITEEEFLNALSKIEEKNKEKLRKIYDDNKEKFTEYPEFDELYEEIKQECSNFDSEKNRKYYIEKYKKSELPYKIDSDFFRYRFIADYVGENTKYGKKNRGFFSNFYRDVAMIFDCQKDKSKYCIQNGKSPIEQIPDELKKHFLYYEVSYCNEVTTSSGLMINYYFKLNEETKNYLLKFKNDFCLEPLEDLALYKDDELEFYSCTHEQFNSIDINYKNMSFEEIENFINDNYFNENNSTIIEILNTLIKMPIDKKFSFKELNIDNSQIIYIICQICNSIKLEIEPVEKQQEGIILSRAQQLLMERRYEDLDIELKKYQNKYQYKEGFYEPLLDEFEKYYTNEILFKKIQ